MSITDQQSEFIQSLDGDLSPEQAANLLEMANGDTALVAEIDSVPTTVADGAGLAEQTDENTVIMAKDGKHTIPFEKLTEARNAEKQWREQAEQAQRQLTELQQSAAARQDQGSEPTITDNQVAIAQAAIDDGANPDLFGDFSEEALATGIKALIEQQVSARVDARMNEALKPFQQKEADTAEQIHYNAIYGKHPDADSIMESKELQDWIQAQPSFISVSINDVLKNGTAQQVVEVFDQFKSTTGSTQGANDAANNTKALAQAAIANTKAQVPTSLTDFPAGRPGAGASKHESMAVMNSQDLSETMQNMTPEQIEQFLNRRL